MGKIPQCASDHCRQQRTLNSEYCGTCLRHHNKRCEEEDRADKFRKLLTVVHIENDESTLYEILEVIWDEIQSLKGS